MLAALPLAACGFTPAYAPGGPAAGLLDRVLVDAPSDKNGFDLVERLEERLGRTRAPAYRLSYTIGTTTEGQGITTTNAVTEVALTAAPNGLAFDGTHVWATLTASTVGNVDVAIDFALTDSATDAVLSRGTVSSFTSYSASGTPVSTVASEEDANKRLMRLLADQIVTRLIATSGQWNRG